MEVYHSLSKEVILIESNHASKLHALIIGINAYPNLAKLKGAVADADAITHFLTSESQLKVPPNQIINLRNETATRRNIIDAIKSLQVNPSIDPGDPILIYYAGHGGRRNATDEWKKAKGAHRVQVIFPYDYDVKTDGSSDPIECIPDRTIAGLLNELSAAKGDNITVIFDSCHSPSGTRITSSMPKKGMLHRQERSAEVKRDIPWSIDSDIVNPELGIIPPPKDDEIRCTNLPLCVNQTSHVHLAACGSQEAAWEEDGRGPFTVALLKAIHANGVDKVTYQNLIRSLPILSSQSPHCYGKHKDRILFNAGFSSGSVAMIPVNFEEETNKIVLQAGAISGVITESIWEIYDSALENVLLGTFRAESPHASTTELVPEETGGDSSYLAHIERAKSGNSGTCTYARQVRAGVIGELRVHFTPVAKKRIFCTGGAEEEISHSIGSGVRDVGYVAHPTADGADIVVSHHSEREVSLRWCDRQAEHYGIATLEKRVYVERIVVDEALFGVAKRKWHLERKNTDSRETTSLVTIELIRLGLKPGRARMMYREQARRNMNIAGIADFEVRREDLYGVKLTSRANRPLYVRMFYFDISDFSISDLFGYQMDGAAIDPKGTFIIGDNAKGGPPLQFALNSSAQVELGYMKVLWSTEPLELEELERKPAFNRVLGQWSRLRGADRDIDQSIEWGTALLTLVQRLPGVGK
ncbi:mycorrhiza-upregulated peptidase C14 [Rhizoctonia solani 123E]|uniref:Mycorrhiza-upregulated peptidase C14 n=1 Tax=Rhizoctonia solani 123E TaxID=1423351 RepID=A0A074SQS4_9AGAM|nr:mycorrhiza-upregulated peptidase C14 [Rhizoctonia solani 123E]